ncbi:MAG TPA: TraB/GumN family protein [Kofleriaceae bacterium]|nr:TraB/GumN family protein [Kofleriaceae bacterium]
MECSSEMRAVLVAVIALAACRGHEDRPAPRPAPPPVQQVTPKAPAPDPWAATPKRPSDAPPTLAERHELADKACPSVTAPFFYRIERGGATSYILGTRHIGVPLAKFPQVVRDQLHGARLAVFEVAPDDDGTVQRPEIDVKAALGAADWTKLEALIGRDTALEVATGRPSGGVLAMMIMYEDPSAMLDNEIQHEVLAEHIPARGLESSKFQDDLIDKLLDLRALKASIEQTKDRAELEHDSEKDLSEYCAGTDDQPGMDPDQRKEWLAAGYTDAELDAMDDELVFRRNAKWIPELEPLLAKGGVFIAVGADHLIGPRGVVSLLRKRGFTLTRLK